jgi:hypothetical protein
LYQPLGVELLDDPHLLEDVERRLTPRIAATLVAGKGRLLEKRDPLPSGGQEERSRRSGRACTNDDYVVNGLHRHLASGLYT